MRESRMVCLALWCVLIAAPLSRAATPSIDQATQTLAADWADRLKAENFEVTVSPPFVIAGNVSEAALAGYRDHTILAAQKALSATYFHTPIDKPILILLFADADSYEKLAAKWFDDQDVPHYGFYRHGDRTMLMNISTGGGTLVHELTHALIAPDFPGVPDWFNEGLASLYEQSKFNGNTITGLPNWRLAGLQKAIRDGSLRPLAELIADPNFRDEKLEGINYAQARYLMEYLQDAGQLPTYYKTFHDNFATDPTGLASLKTVIKPKSLDEFEKAWRAWVLTLKFD